MWQARVPCAPYTNNSTGSGSGTKRKLIQLNSIQSNPFRSISLHQSLLFSSAYFSLFPTPNLFILRSQLPFS